MSKDFTSIKIDNISPFSRMDTFEVDTDTYPLYEIEAEYTIGACRYEETHEEGSDVYNWPLTAEVGVAAGELFVTVACYEFDFIHTASMEAFFTNARDLADSANELLQDLLEDVYQFGTPVFMDDNRMVRRAA